MVESSTLGLTRASILTIIAYYLFNALQYKGVDERKLVDPYLR